VSDPTVLPGAEPFAFEGGSTGILMIHGFTGSPVSMRPIGEWLAGQGLTVVAPRLPGHGTSEEDLATRHWSEWVAEADAALSGLTSRCARIVVFGQSMGGAIALLLAADRRTDVSGLALANPYVWDPKLVLVPLVVPLVRSVKGVAGDIRKPGMTEGGYRRIPLRAVATMRELLRTADRRLSDVTAPLVVFRSGEDHAIPKVNAERVLARVASARKDLVPCPNSYHVVSLDHDAEMVRERVLAFGRSLEA
jgi:carboxylesterase